jgi:hypothetical protein
MDWFRIIVGGILIVGAGGTAALVAGANMMSDAPSEGFQGKGILIACGAACVMGGLAIYSGL